jgi:hypothetical protein
VTFPDWLELSVIQEVNYRRWWRHPRDRWQAEQLAFFVGPGIGPEADAICAAVCGIRARSPWMDVDLTEFFLSLPAEVKFPDYARKSLVRRLLRGKVPNPILERRDKTFFNDWIMDNIDYPTLRKLLINPSHRIKGVNYDVLGEHLNREDLAMAEFKWAFDLAKCHAFLSLW